MSKPNSELITKRSELSRTMSFTEMDTNLEQLKLVIDQSNNNLDIRLRQNMKRLAAEAGFNLVDGSFEEGAVISGWPDVVWSQALGIYLQWHLDEAKTVAAGSSPTNIGTDWIDMIGVTLRGDLSNFMASTKYVSTEQELNDALSSMSQGSIILTSDITLTAGKTTTKNINIKCNGNRIQWTGSAGTALKYYREPFVTESASISAVTGINSISLSSTSIDVGDIIVMYSTGVRWASTDGDYLYGQASRVVNKSGSTYTISPAFIADFTISSIEAYKPFILDLDVDIYAPSTNTTDTSFVSVGWCRDTKVKAAIHGSGPQNVGLGLSGDNVNVDITVTGIKHNFVNLGYGVTVSGNKIKVSGKGADCKHVYDAGTRTFVSTSIEFDMDVTKASDAPLYLYACGVHANTLSPKMRGRVSGCGHLICDRTGSADIDVIFNETASSHSYGLVLVNEIPPSSLKVRGKSSNALCSYVFNSPTGSVGCTGMDIQVESYGKKIIFQQSLNQSVKGLKIHDCKGEFLKFYSNDWTGCDLDVEMFNNRLSTISTATNAYIQDHTAGGNIKVRSRNNIIDDTYVTGYFRFTGTITSIDFESVCDENKGTYRFMEASSITTTAIKQFRVLSPKTSATCNLSLPTTASLYETSGRVQEGQFKHATNPLSFSAWPCYIEANSFKLSSGINLATSIKPGPGNHDLNGNTLTWSSTNQAWPQY